ncbi:TonB-dependent receptor [Nafulsella turpanensis]|uniref:TonB-dependent receptor n=1 Tax=Nafulsella turpanensis TaxID=1265690 RepID=UPI000349201D|nr:carboxypeptidase-like regulatory domain-containing protein [Nafulsella turpanensis]
MAEAAQTPAFHTLSGTVTDTRGEPLVGAYIRISPGNKTAVTDFEGKFSIPLKAGLYQIESQYLSMKKYRREVKLDNDVQLAIVLESGELSLEEVVVTAEPSMDVNAVTMGSSYLDVKTLRKMPSFLGEVDVIRSITTLPGVASAGEGTAGFYVRGGSADQNLILLDDAPVFNSAHLFGFFSVYNPDVLSSYTLHRSGISAQYGGRISSILDVSIKDGNKEALKFYAGLSPVSAKIGFDGPVGKSSSILVAGRAAYPDYILRLFPNEDVKNSSGYFYDINMKFRQEINLNNSLELSSYYSKDGFKFPYDTVYSWSNMLGSLRWNHIFNPALSSSLSLAKSVYQNNVEGIATGEEFILNSGIDYTGLKADFNYLALQNQVIDFGGGIADYKIQPGILEVYGTSSFKPLELQRDEGRELFSYLNNEITFNETISLALGLRYSFFIKTGPADVYIFEEGKPRSETSITDTLSYADGEAAQTYQGLEPRASLKYSLNSISSLKAGYSRTRQYIQLISNTAAITPVDVWKLSNKHILPQVSDQLSIGYFLVKPDNSLEFSWEIYYKWLQNQLDYKDGAKILLNPTLEADLLFGEGTAYGSEWLVKKNEGKVTGWLSLSYSRSFRTIAGETKEETINNGLKYPSNFDKPINLNLFMNYQFPAPRWTFSANFNYSTGRPITASDSWYRYYGKIFANYPGRNQERMPAYHRLDLSINYNPDPAKKIQTSWSLSVYNLYFRRNAYSTLFRHQYGRPPGAYKLSVIGVAVPSLSFNIKF